MAYLLQPDYINYSCSCGKLKPITNLYFCRHCLKIRCGFCICHEVDSHYCANCFENMPSSEARLKKNRCSSCFDCPCCFHTLSTRAAITTQPRPVGEGGDGKPDPKATKKMYYLSCFNCRWTSRDVGIPDQPVATGGWPERLNIYTQRINAIQDYYKSLALQEKQEKMERERKKFALRGKYITLTDKIGLTAAMARGIAGLSDGNSLSSTQPCFLPSQASAEINDLPDDIFTSEVNLKYVTNMAERLAQPEWQPTAVERLYPSPKQLLIKRSQRCRSCDHNLTKPEYNPGSIKFKIELLAYYHVPEIRIISCEPLHPGKLSQLLVKLVNPTGHEMVINFLPLPTMEEQLAEIEAAKQLNKTQAQEGSGSTSLLPSLSRSAWSAIEPVPVDNQVNGEFHLPATSISLPQRDDASEYDEDTNTYNDDPSLVMWRKSNKIALKVSVTPQEGLQQDTEITVGCKLQYTYTNTVAHHSIPHNRQPQEHTLGVSVYLNIGKIV